MPFESKPPGKPDGKNGKPNGCELCENERAVWRHVYEADNMPVDKTGVIWALCRDCRQPLIDARAGEDMTQWPPEKDEQASLTDF